MAAVVQPEAEAVAAIVCTLLAELLRDTVRNAPAYARRYSQARIDGAHPGSPHGTGLHPLLAQLVRDLVLDEMLWRRRAA